VCDVVHRALVRHCRQLAVRLSAGVVGAALLPRAPSPLLPLPCRGTYCPQSQGGASSGGAGSWPLYSTAGDAILRLDALPNRVVVSGVRSAQCDVLDGLSV
jgi:hypothetical protein